MNPELSSFPFPWFFLIFILLLLLAALLLLFLRREKLCLLSFSLLFGLGFLYSLFLHSACGLWQKSSSQERSAGFSHSL